MNQGLCPSCGATVKFATEKHEAKCPYCDTVVTLQQAEAQYESIKHKGFSGTLLIAETAMEGGDYSEALGYFTKVIEQYPGFPDAWLNRGICLVRTSTMNNIKTTEAISAWKAAIKFASNPDAMKKRVALEINNVVTEFYPVLEEHYLKYHNAAKSLDEHGNRFLVLEAALSYAMNLYPTKTICENGVSLCNKFVISIEKAATSNLIAAAAGVGKQLVSGDSDRSWGHQAASDAMGYLSKKGIANNLRKALQETINKYEVALAKVDPEFALQCTIREQQKIESAKAEQALQSIKAEQSKQRISVFFLIGAFIMFLMAVLCVAIAASPNINPNARAGVITMSIINGLIAVVVFIAALGPKKKPIATNPKPEDSAETRPPEKS